MKYQTAAKIGLVLGCIAWAERAQSQEVGASPLVVRSSPAATNLFAGRKARLECQVTARAAADATLSWSVSLERGVIARGEQALKLVPDQAIPVVVEVDIPELRPGLVAPASWLLDVRAPGGLKAQRTIAMFAFSPEVASNREQWMKSLGITLFDPAGKTSAALETAKIPHLISDGPEGLNRPSGLLIHGAGIEPARQSAGWQAAMQAAASGRRVIILASAGGKLPLEELFVAADGRSITLRRSDVIRDLDKRLSFKEWPQPGRMVGSSLHWTVAGAAPIVELRDDASGWTWLDVKYANGGRLVWAGFGVIESWEATPAARYLFVNMLETVTKEVAVNSRDATDP